MGLFHCDVPSDGKLMIANLNVPIGCRAKSNHKTEKGMHGCWGGNGNVSDDICMAERVASIQKYVL